MRTPALLVAAGLLATLTLAVGSASAEWFADLYLGPAFTQRNDIEADSPETALVITLKDVNFDQSVTLGGRAGYWLESVPFFGVGLDVSHFDPAIDAQTRIIRSCVSGFCSAGALLLGNVDLEATVIGVDAWLRYPLLTSPEFPKGRLQPYLNAGPALFIAYARDSSNFDPHRQSDTDTSVGVKAGAGVAWLFLKNFALFGEYRFTHFSPDLAFKDAVAGKTTFRTDVTTHHLLLGVSFRF
jgi:opacity protein-like surface antigen